MKFSLSPAQWFRAVRVSGPVENTAGDLSRRGIIKAVVAGSLMGPLVKLNPFVRATENRNLLRPPFSRVNDNEFMDACIRCGKCIQVCPTNTLQPAYLEAGIEGMMTPVLVPEIAGCEGKCNGCGQVCPTNAIVSFTREEKHTMKQGTAKLELDRCIGYTENADCNACAKACPTQAIKTAVKDGVPKPVKIEHAQCTGCATCEAACNKIITNRSACVTTNQGRGSATDMAAIMKNLKEKEEAGKDYLPAADV